MNWPAYPYETPIPELARFAQGASARGRAGMLYTAAADVWRGGRHLWRSYPAEQSETAYAWAQRELGDGVAPNFDDGPLGAPGVAHVADWPVPTAAALVPLGGVVDVRDLAFTLLAIAQLPSQPYEIDLPSEATLGARVRRHGAVFMAFAAGDASVRLLVARQRQAAAAEGYRAWRVSLARRAVRRDCGSRTFPEVERTFQLPADATPAQVLRAAKRHAGVAAQPAQRRDPSRAEWFLSGAPYLLTIEPVDETAPGA